MMDNEVTWSQHNFGTCDLGDDRRTRRLVDVGARQARQVGASMAQCCEGESATLLGSYRLMRNASVSPEAIREGALARSADQSASCAARLGSRNRLRMRSSTCRTPRWSRDRQATVDMADLRCADGAPRRVAPAWPHALRQFKSFVYSKARWSGSGNASVLEIEVRSGAGQRSSALLGLRLPPGRATIVCPRDASSLCRCGASRCF